MATLSITRDGHVEHSKSKGEANSDFETAEQYFVRRVQSLPGVSSVVPHEVSRRDRGTFEVHVNDSETASAVYGIEAETLLRFPGTLVSAHALTPTGY